MLKDKDFTPVGTKIDGAYENDRNADSSELFKAIIREAFEVTDVIVAHHIVYVKTERRQDPGKDGLPPMEYDFQLVEEVPSADTLIFDHDIAARIWGPDFKDVLVKLALEPIATRDRLLADLYYARQQKQAAE
jgi:hypothetical protein